jgi:hypothetical protein
MSSAVAACAGSPTTATDVTTTSATIESVVTTFRGAVVESAPVTIPSPEALDVATRFTLQAPSDSRVTLYLCVMETASVIGSGSCIGLTSTVAELQQRGNTATMGISAFKTDGVPRTTSYVYVAVADGAFPWVPGTAAPPRVGDRFGANRVLATSQLPRTVTFR